MKPDTATRNAKAASHKADKVEKAPQEPKNAAYPKPETEDAKKATLLSVELATHREV